MFLRFFLPQVMQVFQEHAVTCHVHYTRYAGHATRLVRMHHKRYDSVTVFGGDGTIDEVVKGLGDDIRPIGIIPFGTANVLALDLEIPFDPVNAARTIAQGHCKQVDVGYLNGEPFMLMVSSGLDAFAVHNLNLRAKRYLGKTAYLLSAMWSALTYRSRKVRVVIEEQGILDRGYLAIVSNSRYYGGRFNIDRQIRIDDGLLDVILFKKSSILEIFRLLIGILTQTHRQMEDVAYYRARRIHLASNRRIYMQKDGDKVPFTRADIQVKAKHLPVFVPQPA
jgi:YegS/Rv2252/BmrU family lipid kinase